MFEVNSFEDGGRQTERNTERELSVCRNCLGVLNQMGLGQYTVENFNLRENFKSFKKNDIANTNPHCTDSATQSVTN